MASGLINYDYASITEGVNHMRQINNNIRDQVNNLKSQVQALRAGFTGQASEAYDTCSQNISKDLNQSNEKLDNISASVSRGADAMQGEDANQSRRFQ